MIRVVETVVVQRNGSTPNVLSQKVGVVQPPDHNVMIVHTSGLEWSDNQVRKDQRQNPYAESES